VYKQSSELPEVSGVPGALSNQPPAGGTLSATPGQDAQSTSSNNNTSRAVRNYELDKTISHTRQSPVTLNKLSVAVIVDYRSEVSKKGKVTKTALTEDEIAYITALVKETVGLNEARGDTINVVNTSFQMPERVEALPAAPIWEQPWVWDLAKQGLGGLAVLLLAFGVLRPMLTNLSSQGKQVALVAAAPAGQAQLPATVAGLPNQMPAGGEQLQDMASSMAKEDPQRVAQVMNNWVASDE
jgi:flagellar M-ring protein FliF